MGYRLTLDVAVTGPPAYAEDAWKKIRIGEEDYHVACRAARCRLPNIDPVTAKRHPTEPSKTLRSFRCIDKGAEDEACLGMNVVPAVKGMYRHRTLLYA